MPYSVDLTFIFLKPTGG